MTDARNFLLNTDYPIDIIIGRIIDSAVIRHATSMSDSILITIPHGLSYAPLCVGLFTDVSDFSIYYKFGSSPQFYFSTTNQYTNRIAGTVESDATNIYITFINFDTTRTIYYRVSLLAPNNSGSTDALSPALRQDFYINTDNRIMNLHMYDHSTYNIVNNLVNLVVNHDLGYIPMVMCWTSTNKIRQVGCENTIGVTGVDSYFDVDEQNIYINITDYVDSSIDIYYRIYK